MAQSILDLTGRKGLTMFSEGDTDTVTQLPHLRIDVKEGELAQGFFNPYFREGYLSPVVTNTTTITTDTSSITELSSSVFDRQNLKSYWSNSGRLIFVGDTITDITLATYLQLPVGVVITDLELYTLDTRPSLYYTYHYPADITDKKNKLFFGTKLLDPAMGARVYDFNPSKTSTSGKSFRVDQDTSEALIQPFSSDDLSSSRFETIKISGVRLRLRMPFTGVSQTWTLKVGLWTTVLGTDASLNSHYIPNTLVTSMNVSPALLSSGVFADLFVNFSSTQTLTAGSTYAIVLEPTLIGDIGVNEGFDWYAGDTGASGNDRGLISNTGYYRLSLDNKNKFDMSLLSNQEDNLFSKSSKNFVQNNIPIFYENFTGNYTAAATTNSMNITIKDIKNNIVYVQIISNTTTDNVVSLTVGGVTATLIDKSNFNTDTWQYVYKVEGSTSGSKTVLTTLTTGNPCIVMPVAFYNVKLGAALSFNQQTQNSNNTPASFGVGPFSTAVTFQSIVYRNISAVNYWRIFDGNAGGGIVADNIVSSLVNPFGAIPMRILGYPQSGASGSSYSPSATKIRDSSGSIFDDNARYVTVGMESLYTNSIESYWDITGSRSGTSFMRTADNGFSYIFSDTSVHKFDGGFTGGAVGTFTKNVLQFPEDYTITDALDYRSQFYIALHKYPVNNTTTLNTFTGSCGVVIWNRISTQLKGVNFIEIPGVREIKKIYASTDEVLKLIVINNSGLTEIRQFGYNDSGGVVFPVKKRLGIGSFPQNPDCLVTQGDKTIWQGNDGVVYAEKDNFVTKLFSIKSNPGTSGLTSNIKGGSMMFGSGSETANAGFRSNKQVVTVAYLDSATPVIRKFYPFDLTDGNNTAQSINIGSVYTGVTYIPVTSVLRNVRIYNAPIPGTGSTVIATIKLFFNQSTSSVLPAGMTKTVTKSEAKRGYVDFKINNPNIHGIQILVEWSVSETLGADTYLPNTAVISYDETTTQSPDNG